MSATKARKNKGLKTPKSLLIGVGTVVLLLIIILIVTIKLTVQSNSETDVVLVDSVKAELVATSVGARGIISENIDLFMKINSEEDALDHWDEWVAVVEELRVLNEEIGSEYIYALKEIDGEFFFIFDTDPEVQEARDLFLPYELSSVHEQAFAGEVAVGIMNVVDEWGSFNTGAVPLFDNNGNQVGIVATDIADTFIQKSRDTSSFYTTILVVAISVLAIVMLIVLALLLRRNAKQQKDLYMLANFDPISGLPNRLHLFTFLAREIDFLKGKQQPLAVYFIDLDNFKTVNDQAGHDTGDKLLRAIATFLDTHVQSGVYAENNGIEAITARIGGDEFLQLLPGVASIEQGSEYAQGLLDAFRKEPDLIKYVEEFGVGLSIGVALFPSMQTDYDILIKYADIAMYYAKKDGKDNYKVYNEAMGDDVDEAELTVRTKRGSSR